MHLARPTMIRPVRYAGWSGSRSHASANISAGPTSQLSTAEETNSLRPQRATFRAPHSGPSRARDTSSAIAPPRSAAKSPLPAPSPTCHSRPGSSDPRPRPAAIASKIHTGRNRSKRERRSTTASSSRARSAGSGARTPTGLSLIPARRTDLPAPPEAGSSASKGHAAHSPQPPRSPAPSDASPAQAGRSRTAEEAHTDTPPPVRPCEARQRPAAASGPRALSREPPSRQPQRRSGPARREQRNSHPADGDAP